MSSMRVGPLVILAVGVVVTPRAAEGDVSRIRSRIAEPIAIRGGVLMVPLAAARPGDHWPRTITLTLSGGRRVEGLVAWVETAARGPGGWADDPRGLVVRSIDPADDTSRPGSGAPYLLARLPADGHGPLKIARCRINPSWHDPPPQYGGLPSTSATHTAQQVPDYISRRLEVGRRPDRPDPDSPFEYWRWVLLAQRLGMAPPTPRSYPSQVQRLVAIHYADLWRLGLARLAAVSPGVAAQCREWLTQICRDGDRPFACWVADPLRVSGLLLLLLDFKRPERAVLEGALAWADTQELILVWAAVQTPHRVTVAIANPTYDPIVARLTWMEVDQIPVAAQVGPGALKRVVLECPPTGDAPVAGPDGFTRELLVEVAGRQKRLTFRRPGLPAAPPGIDFPPLEGPLTLAALQGGRRRPVGRERMTLGHFRKLNGRWEIFLECRRPAPAESQSGDRVLGNRADYLDTRGIEAVTLLVGAAAGLQAAPVILTVAEHGPHRLFQGTDDGTLQIHRRSAGDRWYCRIVLPEFWAVEQGGPPNLDALQPEGLPNKSGPAARRAAEQERQGRRGAATPAARGGTIAIGLVRTHGDSDAVETGPDQGVPWRRDPGAVVIDLTRWDK